MKKLIEILPERGKGNFQPFPFPVDERKCENIRFAFFGKRCRDFPNDYFINDEIAGDINIPTEAKLQWVQWSSCLGWVGILGVVISDNNQIEIKFSDLDFEN
jgi:hypothetical protein